MSSHGHGGSHHNQKGVRGLKVKCHSGRHESLADSSNSTEKIKYFSSKWKVQKKRAFNILGSAELQQKCTIKPFVKQ